MNEKILVLCDVPPCENYTGGLMLSQLMKFLLEENVNLSCFCTMDVNLTPKYKNNILNKINYVSYNRPIEWIKDNEEKKYYKEINVLKKKLIKFVKDNNITKIWCPLQGEVLTLLLKSVYDETNIPYVVQIWDPIEWWIREHHFSDDRKESTLKIHEEVIKNSSCCITTSLVMSKYFKKNYGVKCVEVMPPLKRKKFASNSKDNDKFIIAMSGQIYAKDELDAMLSALDLMNWKIGKKDVYFEHFGMWSDSYVDFTKHDKYKDRFIKRGFINQDKLLYELSLSDLLYCPYFFSDDEVLKMVSTLSFPSKVVTYLAIDVPTIFHGPSYAGPYKFLKENNCSFLIDSNDPKKIKKELESIDSKKINNIYKNVSSTFNNNFDSEVVKKNLFKSLDIKLKKDNKLNILEVNNIDLPGRRFNGYDLIDYINNNTKHKGIQIVTTKLSDCSDVHTFYPDSKSLEKEPFLMESEREVLSVHTELSYTSNLLKNSDDYKDSDIVHYHLIHNTKMNLASMIELCSEKPSVLTLHDPWNFTGRCVYPQECNKWKDGCINCPNLSNLFSFTEDNCNSLWNLKKKVYEKLDVDIIVSTPFMKKMIEESPITNFKNIHILPFGIDLDKFENSNVDRNEAKKKFNIESDEIVLFFRSQMAMKGTEFIIEAMKELETDKKICLLSCSEVGVLDELKEKYHVIELGEIGDKVMVDAYNACDIFLMPSRGESFGLMAIEAMASSRPVVVFDNSALPYVSFAPECGVLVENKNSHKLMEAIKMLIDDPKEREKRGKLGRKLAEENYDLNVYNKKLIEIYEKAYERQKNKVVQVKDSYSIDKNSKDVQALIPKLEEVFTRNYPYRDFPIEISNLKDDKIKIKKDFKIDYSSWDVINLIELFNDKLYDELIYYSNFGSKTKIQKLMYYLKNDKDALIRKFYYKICRIPGIRTLYRIILKLFKKEYVIKDI